MANFVYNYGKFLLANGSLNLLTQNIALMLVTPGYEASNTVAYLADANNVSEIASFELVDGTGAGQVNNYIRMILTDKSVVENDDTGVSNGFAFFKAANVTFTGLGTGNTVGGCVLIKDSGSNTTSPLIAFYDVIDTPTNGGDITIQWASDANGGVLKLT